ncbi:MAG TPA: HAD family hydrolase [Verrucomicrobiae bacterium]|nr:HAD family hydrolase [Verrucomicrobiae bacterium]
MTIPRHDSSLDFKPKHKWFLGFDSDGTVFNSMEIKQKRIFLPLAVELFGLQAVAKEFHEIGESINLYSETRGINRFQAMARALNSLQRHPQVRAKGIRLPDFSALQDFVRSGRALTTASLADYNREKSDPFLAKVIAWSTRSDDQYAQITKEEGNPPYPQIRPVLERAAGNADLMIVSGTPRRALLQDWGDTNLLPFINFIGCQEMGSKTDQLRFAVNGNYEPHRTLMIGDAPGDLKAAQANHVMFYPIMPGQEAQSWARFLDEGFDRFLSERYAGDYERQLVDEFVSRLRMGHPKEA